MRQRARLSLSMLAAVLVWCVGISAQTPHKKPITHDVYDSWKSIQGTKISRDGVWVAYALVPQDGDGELVVRNLKTNAEYRAPRGRDPIITPDGKFVVFTKAPIKADVDKARKAASRPGGRGSRGDTDAPKSGVGFVDLSSGQVTTLAEHVKSFKLPEDPVRFVAYLTQPEAASGREGQDGRDRQDGQERSRAKKHEPGTYLIVRDLATTDQTAIPEVAEYAVAKDGSAIAYSVASTTPASEGAFVRTLADGSTKTLLTGAGDYKGFVFDGKNSQLAFISNKDDSASKAPRFKLYHATMTSASAQELTIPAETRAGPIAVSENGRLEFSKDGARLFFATAAPPKPEPDDAADLIKVDIWNYKDAELQPMQKVRADEEKKRSFRAVVHLADRKVALLASPDMPEVRTGDYDRALGISDVPYRQLISWDGNYDDVYLVKVADGSRQRILEKAHFQASMSPGGAYVLSFEEKDDSWYAIRTSDGQKTNLTARLGVKFQSETDDHPDHAPPYGSAGWTDGDKSVLLYDRYDIWDVKPDGSGGRMITNGLGRRNQIVFRYSRTEQPAPSAEPEEGGLRQRQQETPTVSSTRPIILSAVDERTRASGLYRVTISAGVNQDPAKLIMLDKSIGVPIKARDADVYVFTASRFEEFPNLWTSTGAFTDMKKISDANPQQALYNWGTSELIDYVNADGKHLKAILTKPEDFDPSKKYPMLVYIYEQLSNNLHRYVPPAPGGSSINVTRYVSNGYVVLQPDIVYDVGYPGQSALKCVLPAVQQVVAKGFVDPARVGIQGHSWGGYQITYMITQTNIFRAVEAGASVVDMFGGYGGIRWGTGMSRAFQYEKTQSRIGVTPWENPYLYMENSAIFSIEKIHTPYLTMANDEDDAVPWQQGIEFFTAMRRLGKEAYMFVYNGEKHGLRQRENQKHWTVHLAEYFDYFLKDAPKPDWMEHGVPYLEKGKRDVSVFYKKSTDQQQ
ncbi:MAG TPA: prolyl oligopeptidase family serine peptidase [Vicinamibacterales bacterium]